MPRASILAPLRFANPSFSAFVLSASLIALAGAASAATINSVTLVVNGTYSTQIASGFTTYQLPRTAGGNTVSIWNSSKSVQLPQVTGFTENSGLIDAQGDSVIYLASGGFRIAKPSAYVNWATAPTLPTYSFTTAPSFKSIAAIAAVNGIGTFVGYSTGKPAHALMEAIGASKATDLSAKAAFLAVGSSAHAINSAGVITGTYNTTLGTASGPSAYVYSGTTGTKIGPAAKFSAGLFVNASGQVAGTAWTQGGVVGGFYYNGTTTTTFGTSAAAIAPVGLDDGGAVHGSLVKPLVKGNVSSEQHGFTFAAGTLTDYGVPSGFVSFKAIASNSAGGVIGDALLALSDSFSNYVGRVAFLLDGGTYYNLDTAIKTAQPSLSGLSFVGATDIDNAGNILVTARDGSGNQSLYLVNITL